MQYADYEEMFKAEGEATTLDPSDRAGGTFQPGLDYWRLVQITPGMDELKLIHPGEWHTKNSDGIFEFQKAMNVIILESRPRLTRFEAEHIACRSHDGAKGPEGQDCRATCEYFPFRVNTIPKQDKCRGSMVLLCVSADEPLADSFFVELSASGIADWREYASWLQDQKHKPVFACSTKITSVARKQGGGKPYVPVFRPLAALPADLLVEMRDRRIADSRYLDAPGTPTVVPDAPGATWDQQNAPPDYDESRGE